MNQLVIMTKTPRPGRVKTRLAAGIGPVAATWWLRHQLADRARRLTSDRWHTRFAVAPDREVNSPTLPPLPRVAQGPGDLGARMARLFRTLPRGPILIIGADIPGVTPAHVALTFRELARHGSVIGPAPDGGYWAVGLDTRRPVPRDLFQGVRWSSPHALADTLGTLPPPVFLPELADVDTAEDLARFSR